MYSNYSNEKLIKHGKLQIQKTAQTDYCLSKRNSVIRTNSEIVKIEFKLISFQDVEYN